MSGVGCDFCFWLFLDFSAYLSAFPFAKDLAHLSRRLTRWAYSIPTVRHPSYVVRPSTPSNKNIDQSWLKFMCSIFGVVERLCKHFGADPINCGCHGNRKLRLTSLISSSWQSSWHYRWRCNGAFPFHLSMSACPQGICKRHACSFFDVIFPSLLLSSSHSCSFHCTLQNCLRHARGSGHTICFRFFTMVRRSSCTPITFWIMVWTSSFDTWSL